MDGVLADFHKSALAAHGVAENRREQWPIYGQDLQERLGLGIHDHKENLLNQEKFWGPLNLIKDFWINLEPFPWVAELIQACRSYTDKLIICTSPAKSWNGEDKRQKLEWLRKYDIIGEVLFPDRKASLSERGTVLIDDWEKQVYPFADGEGNAILFPQPWNANHAQSDYSLEFTINQLKGISRIL